ncbi:MAG: DUF29 family protein [Emticicia sp.]|nr:DUF29 family protein [Emticicia sp.]
MKNWIEIASHSELSAVEEIKKSFDEGDLVDVEEGLIQLAQTMANSERKALLSQLKRLMLHIIKWKIQSQKRSKSWIKSINDAREEIELAQEFSPSLNKNYIESIWEKTLKLAKRGAEDEMEISLKNTEIELTWQEVFEQEYNL